MSETKDYWSGRAGYEYHSRNHPDWMLRANNLFTRLIQQTGARSVLEVGCGTGVNLSACALKAPYLKTYGMEINEVASARATKVGHTMLAPWELPQYEDGIFDMTMTVGCLIHVPPGELTTMMTGIANASSRWVLCAEYHADEEEEVEYRGKKGLLWKRNYRRLYEDLGLKHHMSGFLGPEHGFDNITWTLLTR